MGNGEMTATPVPEAPGNGADGVDDDEITESDVTTLDLILDEVRRVRKAQQDQGGELEKIKDELKDVREAQIGQAEEIGLIKERLGSVSTTLDIVFQTQVAHGKELGEMKQQCGKRFETCSQAMKKLRDRQTGEDKSTGSWPAKAKEGRG